MKKHACYQESLCNHPLDIYSFIHSQYQRPLRLNKLTRHIPRPILPRNPINLQHHNLPRTIQIKVLEVKPEEHRIRRTLEEAYHVFDVVVLAPEGGPDVEGAGRFDHAIGDDGDADGADHAGGVGDGGFEVGGGGNVGVVVGEAGKTV